MLAKKVAICQALPILLALLHELTTKNYDLITSPALSNLFLVKMNPANQTQSQSTTDIQSQTKASHDQIFTMSHENQKLLSSFSIWAYINAGFKILIGILNILLSVLNGFFGFLTLFFLPAAGFIYLFFSFLGLVSGVVQVMVSIKLISAAKKTKLASESNNKDDFDNTIFSTIKSNRAILMFDGIGYFIITASILLSIIFISAIVTNNPNSFYQSFPR